MFGQPGKIYQLPDVTKYVASARLMPRVAIEHERQKAGEAERKIYRL